MARMVMCVKFGRELPGLEKPPFPGELGQRIFEHVSQQAWDMWPAQSTLIINHYGLNMADPEARNADHIRLIRCQRANGLRSG